MNSEQTIFRAHRTERDRFTALLNETIRDPRLSFRATGLLVFLLSLPPDWKASQHHITTCKTEGRDAVVSAWNELRKIGYIHKDYEREKGRIVRTIWNIFETPHRPTEKPKTAEPKTADPPLQRTEGNEGLTEKNPLTPKGGRSKRPRGEGRIPETELEKRICGIFHMRLTTKWGDDQCAAYRDWLKNDPDLEELTVVEEFYAANWPPGSVENIFLRATALTFFRHYNGEITKAHAWKDYPHLRQTRPKNGLANGHREPITPENALRLSRPTER